MHHRFFHIRKLFTVAIPIALSLFAFPAAAQTIEEVHRKHRLLLQYGKEDTVLADRLFDYATDLHELDDDSAMALIDKALAISRRLENNRRIGTLICARAQVLTHTGQLDSGLAEYGRSLDYLLKERGYRYTGVAWTGIGNTMMQSGRLDTAAQAYFHGIEAYREAGDTVSMAHAYNGLSIIFSQMEQLQKSLHYLRKAEVLYVQRRDSGNHIKVLINMGDKYTRLNQPSDAAVSFREAIRISDLAQYQLGRFYARVGIADLYATKKLHTDSALIYLHEAERIARGFTLPPLLVSSMHETFGLAYFESGNSAMAREHLLKAGPVLKDIGHVPTLMQHSHLLTKVNIQLGQKAAAMDAFDDYVRYRDSLQKTDVATKVNELETKYRTLEKDKSLADQQLAITKKDLELRKKGGMLAALGGGLLLVLAIAGGIYFHFRQQQQLQRQQMQLIQKEAELAMAQASMEGEEKERARLARNLHDGAGSILSGVKLYLASLETEYRELSQSAPYRNTLSLLNDAVSEIRNTSHNLMPRPLFEEGLDMAAHAYCEKLSRHHSLEIEYLSFGEPRRFNAHFELMIYRTLQELLANVIKHAEATHVFVQLNFGEEMFSLTVEDDGKGFTDTGEAAGIGMFDLRSRVEAFRGTMDVESSAEGTSVLLALPLNAAIA